MSLAYGGPQQPAVQQCQRYRRDGSRCPNLTTQRDGWCRGDDCDGFRRASMSSAPPPPDWDSPLPPPSALQPAIPVGVALPPIDATAVHITQRAIDSYRFHHGGSSESAVGDLRDMLAAFAAESRVRPSGSYVALSHDGYKLVLNEQLDALTNYGTVHRERTWAQLQAGVASRFPGGGSKGSMGRLLKEPPAFVPLRCDAATVAVDRHAWRGFGWRLGLQDRPAEELEAALRRFIAELPAAALGAVRTDETVEFTAGEVRVILSADQRKVVGVLWPRRRPGEEGG
jgi:hypothetical protein